MRISWTTTSLDLTGQIPLDCVGMTEICLFLDSPQNLYAHMHTILLNLPSCQSTEIWYDSGLELTSKRPSCAAIDEGKTQMPKLKTHKGIKKRFRVTSTGKVKHRHSGTSHLAYRMTKKRRRKLRGTDVVCTCEAKKIIKALAGYDG